MSNGNTDVHFWQGNQACAEGALAAGCRFFAGYPITPASEIAEIMAKRLPEMNGRYLQMEDEIGAISAVVGASWGGFLAMTATSGPGFSLMQENIGYAIMTETPCVLVDVQRAGPSTGQATKGAQGDFLQSRWGTHGDHESIVLSPNSAQETFELTIKAFELAEYFRHPVIILSDEVIGHSREKVVIDTNRDYTVKRVFAGQGKNPYGETDDDGHALMPRFGNGHNLLITGSTHDERGYRKTADPGVHRRLVERLRDKILQKRNLLTDIIINGPEKAEWGIVSFGCTSRTVEEVMFEFSDELSMKSLRLRTLWPFPDEQVRTFAESVERLLVPELSLGQLSREVERVVGDVAKVSSLNKIGGGLMIEPEEIVEAMSSF
ncbi:2-oxoacid:acceptor oxidoreductase subunit alpha [Candidatus Thorarchaeota archaeon]|nr:MAG: 2-oxoacid:acceptor oxidoreductase subunit alpha [Candidatus Thorarchaeota archaeon]